MVGHEVSQYNIVNLPTYLKSYKRRKSSKSPEERGFKSAKDSVLGHPDTINSIMNALQFTSAKIL